MTRRRLVAVAGAVSLALGGLACGAHTSAPPVTATVTVTTSGATTAAPTTTAPPATPVPRGFRPLSFTAVSRDTFWLLGATACRDALCPTVVQTTDGGAQFTTVPAPPAPVDVSGDTVNAIDELRFATDQTGFAFDEPSFHGGANPSGPIWETHDDGAHWAKLPFDDVRAFATGNGTLYLVRARCDTNACAGVTLIRRPLAGGSWASTRLSLGRVDQLIDLAVHGSSVWISVSESDRPTQTLLHSSDGGSSFTASTSPCTNGLGGDLEPTSPSVVWAVCPTGMLAGAARSTNGGSTWRTLDVGRELANSARIAPASDSTALIATGNQSELLRTTDGGTTFVRVYPARAGFWDFLGFTDATTGTGLRSVPGGTQKLVVARSDDSGATWTPLSVG